MRPKKDEFETGKFYRRWIQRNYIFGYVVFPLLGVLNVYNFAHAVSRGSVFGMVMGLIGLAVVIPGIWRTRGQVADVRRRWMEMDVLTHNNRALQSRIDVHLGRKN
jgi:hypothetical protein